MGQVPDLSFLTDSTSKPPAKVGNVPTGGEGDSIPNLDFLNPPKEESTWDRVKAPFMEAGKGIENAFDASVSLFDLSQKEPDVSFSRTKAVSEKVISDFMEQAVNIGSLRNGMPTPQAQQQLDNLTTGVRVGTEAFKEHPFTSSIGAAVGIVSFPVSMYSSMMEAATGRSMNPDMLRDLTINEQVEAAKGTVANLTLLGAGELLGSIKNSGNFLPRVGKSLSLGFGEGLVYGQIEKANTPEALQASLSNALMFSSIGGILAVAGGGKGNSNELGAAGMIEAKDKPITEILANAGALKISESLTEAAARGAAETGKPVVITTDKIGDVIKGAEGDVVMSDEGKVLINPSDALAAPDNDKFFRRTGFVRRQLVSYKGAIYDLMDVGIHGEATLSDGMKWKVAKVSDLRHVDKINIDAPVEGVDPTAPPEPARTSPHEGEVYFDDIRHMLAMGDSHAPTWWDNLHPYDRRMAIGNLKTGTTTRANQLALFVPEYTKNWNKLAADEQEIIKNLVHDELVKVAKRQTKYAVEADLREQGGSVAYGIGLATSPEIPGGNGARVLNTDFTKSVRDVRPAGPKFRQEFVDKIAKSKWAQDFTAHINQILPELLQAMHDAMPDNARNNKARFVGISLDGHAGAWNHSRGLLGSVSGFAQKALKASGIDLSLFNWKSDTSDIVLNPFAHQEVVPWKINPAIDTTPIVMEEGKLVSRIPVMIQEQPNFSREKFLETQKYTTMRSVDSSTQILGTLVHEIVHNWYGGHGKDFEAGLKRAIEATVDIAEKYGTKTDELMNSPEFKELYKDYKDTKSKADPNLEKRNSLYVKQIIENAKSGNGNITVSPSEVPSQFSSREFDNAGGSRIGGTDETSLEGITSGNEREPGDRGNAGELRTGEAKRPVQQLKEAVTGKPISIKLMRGEGGTESKYNPLGAQVPILGEGRYGTESRSHAEEFGPNVTEHTANLEKPLVISSDAQWRELTSKVGMMPNPFGGDVKATEGKIAALRKYIESKGYDGVVVKVPEDEATGKTMQRVFGDSQVVEFPKKEVATPTPEKITAAAVRTKEGKIGLGKTHFEAEDDLAIEGRKYGLEYGFQTNTGRFVTRKEAADIALASKQITPETPLRTSSTVGGPGLIAELTKGIENQPERITAATVKDIETNKTYQGTSHFAAQRNMEKAVGTDEFYRKIEEEKISEGFATTQRSHITREEAMQLAKSNGQYEPIFPHEKSWEAGGLISEETQGLHTRNVESAASNNMSVDDNGQVRDRESGIPIGKADPGKVEEVINSTGQAGGPDLSPPDVPPPADVKMPPPSQPQRPHLNPGVVKAPGMFEKLVKSVEIMLPWQTKKSAFMRNVDTLHGTQLFAKVWDPIYNVTLQMGNAMRPFIQVARDIQIKAEGLSAVDQSHVFYYREALSVQDILQGKLGRVPTQAEMSSAIDWSGKKDGEAVDMQKLYIYTRERSELLQDYQKALDNMSKATQQGNQGMMAIRDMAIKDLQQRMSALDAKHAITTKERRVADEMDQIRKAGDLDKQSLLYTSMITDKWTNPALDVDRATYAARNGMNAKQIQIAELIDAFYNKMADAFGIENNRRLGAYTNHYRQYGEEPAELTSLQRKPGLAGSYDREFASSMIRSGEIYHFEDNPFVAMANYIHQGFKTKYLTPVIDVAQKAAVVELNKIQNPGIKFMAQEYTRQYVDGAKGKPPIIDKYLQDGLQNTLSHVGINMSNDGVKRWFNAFLSWSSAAMLAGKPELALRDMGTYTIMSTSRLGPEWTGNAMKAMYDGRAEEIFKQGKVAGMTANDFQSMQEMWGALDQFENGTSEKITNLMQQAGNAAIKYNGQKSVFQLLYAGTYAMGMEKVTPLLKDFYKGKLTSEQFAEQAKLHTFDAPIANQFINLVNQGRELEAVEFFSRQLAVETAFIHGFNDHPYLWNSVAGRLFGQFGTYPVSALNFVSRLATRGTKAQRAASVATFVAATAAVKELGYLAGFDLSNWSALHSLSKYGIFTGGPIVQNAAGTANLVKAAASSAMGAESTRAESEAAADFRREFGLQYSEDGSLTWSADRFKSGFRSLWIPGSYAFHNWLDAVDMAGNGYGILPVVGRASGFNLGSETKDFLTSYRGGNPPSRDYNTTPIANIINPMAANVVNRKSQ